MKANRQAKVYTAMLESEQLYEEAFAAAVLPDSTNAASSPTLPSLQASLLPLALCCIFFCAPLPFLLLLGFLYFLVPLFLSYFILSNSGVSPPGFVHSATMAVTIDYLSPGCTKKHSLERPEPEMGSGGYPGTIGEEDCRIRKAAEVLS